jgi:YHS domain-containing protein
MQHAHENNHHAMSETTQTVTDPVCGMQVDPAKTEHHAVHEGVTYAFCSTSPAWSRSTMPRVGMLIPCGHSLVSILSGQSTDAA